MLQHLVSYFLFPTMSTYTTLPTLRYHAGVACLYAEQPRTDHVLVYFHGNGQDLGTSWRQLVAMAEALHMTAVAMEYRGYGCMAMQSPSVDGIVTDARRVLRHLNQTYRHVHVCGYSIGAAIAAAAVRHEPCHQVVLVAPFYSVARMVKDVTGSGLLAALCDATLLNTGDALSHLPTKVPITVVHGAKDTLIPIDHAHTLKYHVPRIDVHVQADRGHNDMDWLEVHCAIKKYTS